MRTTPTTGGVLVCDGNSLAYRAYFALVRQQLHGPWVTHGVIQMLATAWDVHGPFDAVVFTFDSPTNHRKTRWPEYKANREERDPELYRQIDQLRTLLDTGGIPTVSCDGWEADDLIATAATQATEHRHVWILTSDRDLLACAGTHTTVLRISSSIRDTTAFTPQQLAATYGVEPRQYRDFAALRGDPSDGLEGVRGIGEKTAAKLLARFGDGEQLYANLDQLTPTQRRNLQDGESAFRRNVELMTFNTDLDVPLGELTDAGIDRDQLTATLDEAGLSHAAARLRTQIISREPVELPPPPDEPPPPDGSDNQPPAPPPPPATGSHIAGTPPTQHQLFP